MIVTASHRLWACLAAGLTALIVGIGVIAVTLDTGGRAKLLAALQRPVAPAAGSVRAYPAWPWGRALRGRARLAVGNAVYALRVAPNRASVPNRLALAVSSAGRPVTGAAITITFSMPAMNMWQVFAVKLAATSRGRYLAKMPFVGMAGGWRLDVTVRRAGHRVTGFVVEDAFGS